MRQNLPELFLPVNQLVHFILRSRYGRRISPSRSRPSPEPVVLHSADAWRRSSDLPLQSIVTCWCPSTTYADALPPYWAPFRQPFHERSATALLFLPRLLRC